MRGPENNPSKAKRVHRLSEIERLEEIVISPDNQFFFALTHHRHLRSVLPFRQLYLQLLSLLFFLVQPKSI